MLYHQFGSPETVITSEDLRRRVFGALDALGPRHKVLVIPPDFTRHHSRGGEITSYIWEYYGGRLAAVLPALGTHAPMTEAEIERMFGAIPRHLFKVHNWRTGLHTLGVVPGSVVADLSSGAVDYDWPVQVNEEIVNGGYDLILSVGQVVPHEVVGMANHAKNVFVGTGGPECINKSHFLGAVCGMERIMGRADTPVRRLFNYAAEHFASTLPIVYMQTVVARQDDGTLVTRGLYIGDDLECFDCAARLSVQVNVQMLDAPLRKVVVYLNAAEFKSTWLGNKAIYRTRMALENDAELVILAPGVHEFGEDRAIDALIRKYGYCGTPKVLGLVKSDPELAANLSAAAHLIHGSSEGRFRITYCPGGLSAKEIEKAGFRYGDLKTMQARYDINRLTDGFNRLPDGEEIYYISNPAIGLWACRDRFS